MVNTRNYFHYLVSDSWGKVTVKIIIEWASLQFDFVIFINLLIFLGIWDIMGMMTHFLEKCPSSPT